MSRAAAPAPPRTLHVGAMPFPSPQGTQAAVASMVGALADAGRETHLLTYGFGTEAEAPPRFRWHRLPDVPRVRSLRSGPSLAKVALDARLLGAIRRLHAQHRPDAIVAHHVEACAAAVLAGVGPVVFVAHTALEPEMPTYLPAFVAPAGAVAGLALERWLSRRATAVAAITPSLARYFAGRVGAVARDLTVPWPVPPPHTADEREAARRAIGLEATDEVALYAGNLDAYQGWPDLVAALAALAADRPRLRLLVATASDPVPLRREARRGGVADRLRIVPLAGELERRRIHAAADLAVVPRRAPGGLPIKLLDALARGVPVVAPRRATAGLDFGTAALITVDDDPEALATAMRVGCGAGPEVRQRMGDAGRRYVRTAHSSGRFVSDLDAIVSSASP